MAKALFYVVDLPSSAVTPLLAYDLCKELGLIADLAGLTTQQRGSNVDPVKDYAHLFSRQGNLQTGYEYSVTLKSEITPFSPPARRLPPALHTKVQDELQRMENAGVIRKITDPTIFCAPMVVAYKKSGDIRICADFRKLNQNIEREQFQMPTFEEMSAKVSNPKFFSQLDCKIGFHQIPVHKDSQGYLSFSSPTGRWAYRKLPFGISSAPEIFSRCMHSILEGISNVLIYIDDVVIWGTSREEHDNTLKEVLRRLDDAGLALNREKCQFGVQSVNFLGHIWSTEGISPDPSKISAITEMPLPDSIQSLRTFLGLATYAGQRHVPHFSTLVSPLWDLTKQTNLQWDETSKLAFETVRSAIANATMRSYLNRNKPVTIQVDASGIGIGAALIQEGRVLIFASRSLTAIERRYAQIEREFLSIVFVLKRFSMTLLGLTVEIQTDHAPIINILRKPLDAISNRMQRWVVSIQHFNFSIKHIRGVDNIVADALSRNPVSGQASPEELAEHTVCFVLKSLGLNLSNTSVLPQKVPKTPHY